MDDVAAAIADPVRRELLEMLRDSPRSAGEMAARFTISRPAVSRHLRVLRESGLVRDTLVGRSRVYELDPTRLTELARWLARFAMSNALEQRFDALETEVHRTRRERRRRDSTPQRKDKTA